MTAMEIARKTGMPEKSQAQALQQLCDAGFLSQRGDGAWVVERFREHQEKGSKDRVRKHRERRALQVTGGNENDERFGNDQETPEKQVGNDDVTLHGRYGNALDKDKEKDKENTHTARASEPVLDFVRWFVRTGIEIGPIAAHFDPALAASMELDRSRKEAEAMLKTYGRPECEARARRLLEALQAAKLRGQPWIKTLSERWTWPEVSGVEAASKVSRLRPVVAAARNPDIDAIPDAIDPATADLAAVFARKGNP